MTLVRVDGRNVDVVDLDCPHRPCYVFGFDKGPYTAGVGYTRPDTPWLPVCLQRHLHGCPSGGVKLQCWACHRYEGPVVMGDDERPPLPSACPVCWEVGELYWLSVPPDPKPCCAAPSVAKPRKPHVYRQRCRGCGSWLTGKQLEIARAQ